jgi:hypothetical protein
MYIPLSLLNFLTAFIIMNTTIGGGGGGGGGGGVGGGGGAHDDDVKECYLQVDMGQSSTGKFSLKEYETRQPK